MSVFSFDGRKGQINEDSEIDIIRSQILDTDELKNKITLSEIKDSIDNQFIRGTTDYPFGYLICHDFEGELFLDNDDKNIVFGSNKLTKKALRSLFENIDSMEREEIVEEIDYILENLAISDFEYFQLTMLKVYHLAYLTRFEENIEILLDLENRYREFDGRVIRLIENSKLNRQRRQSKYYDRGYFKFDYAYLQFSLGYNYRFLDKNGLAIEHYDKAFELWNNKDPTLYLEDMVKTLYNAETICYINYDNSTALDYLNRALSLIHNQKTEDMIDYEIKILQAIALNNLRLMRFDESIKFIKKALELAQLLNNQKDLLSVYMSFGNIIKHKDPKKGIIYLEKAFQEFEKTSLDITYLLNILFQLSTTKIITKDYQGAINHFDEFSKKSENIDYPHIGDQLEFLRCVLAIETEMIDITNPEIRLYNLFKSQHTDIEVKTYIAIQFLKYLNKEFSNNINSIELINDILAFSNRYNINSIRELLDQEEYDNEKAKELIWKQLPLLELNY